MEPVGDVAVAQTDQDSSDNKMLLRRQRPGRGCGWGLDLYGGRDDHRGLSITTIGGLNPEPSSWRRGPEGAVLLLKSWCPQRRDRRQHCRRQLSLAHLCHTFEHVQPLAACRRDVDGPAVAV